MVELILYGVGGLASSFRLVRVLSSCDSNDLDLLSLPVVRACDTFPCTTEYGGFVMH